MKGDLESTYIIRLVRGDQDNHVIIRLTTPIIQILVRIDHTLIMKYLSIKPPWLKVIL